jgi:hypothetical protein
MSCHLCFLRSGAARQGEGQSRVSHLYHWRRRGDGERLLQGQEEQSVECQQGGKREAHGGR